MIENITEKRLKNLAIKINIPARRGWKNALAGRFNHKKQNVISTWIKRGVPEDFQALLADAHIDPALWDEIIVNICEESPISEGEKGGDPDMRYLQMSVERMSRYIDRLEKDNARLEGEVLRLTTGEHDRRKATGT